MAVDNFEGATDATYKSSPEGVAPTDPKLIQSTSNLDDHTVDPTLPAYTDVVIVGAGPAGLALAIELTRCGVPCVVLDHSRHEYPATPSPDMRGLLPTQAILLSTATLDILQDLGVMEKITLHGRAVQGASVLLKGELHHCRPRFPPSERTRYQSGMILEQWKLERTLCERLNALGGKIYRHHVAFRIVIRVGAPRPGSEDELSADLPPLFDPEEYKVKVLVKRMNPVARRPAINSPGHWIRAKYVVGADGIRSITRRALEVEWEVLGPANEYLVADFQVEAWADKILQAAQNVEGPDAVTYAPIDNHYYIIHSRQGSGLLFPFQRPGVWRLCVQRSGTALESSEEDANKASYSGFGKLEAPKDEDLKEIMSQLVPDTVISAVYWRMAYSADTRLAKSFVKERGIIIGDAARLQSPLWSGGINAAFGDAARLGWRLVAALKNGANAEPLLRSYEIETRETSLVQLLSSLQKQAKLMDFHLVSRATRNRIIPALLPSAGLIAFSELDEALALAVIPPLGALACASPIDTGDMVGAARVLGFTANEDSAPRPSTLRSLSKDGSHALLLVVRVLPHGTRLKTLFGCERQEMAPRYEPEAVRKLDAVATLVNDAFQPAAFANETFRAGGQKKLADPDWTGSRSIEGKLFEAPGCKIVWVICGLVDRALVKSAQPVITGAQLVRQVPLQLKEHILHGADVRAATYSVIDHQWDFLDRLGLTVDATAVQPVEVISKTICSETQPRRTAAFAILRPDGHLSVKGYPDSPEDVALLEEYLAIFRSSAVMRAGTSDEAQ